MQKKIVDVVGLRPLNPSDWGKFNDLIEHMTGKPNRAATSGKSAAAAKSNRKQESTTAKGGQVQDDPADSEEGRPSRRREKSVPNSVGDGGESSVPLGLAGKALRKED